MKFTWIARLGAQTLAAFSSIGMASRLLVQMIGNFGFCFQRTRLLGQQIHFLGNLSLLIIVISANFIGAVLALQSVYALNQVGSEAMVGAIVALSLVRELSPVIVAILFAGRAGTSLTAEIGLMKAGEQLAAMEMMGVDPVRRLYTPRFWAAGLSVPLLSGIFSVVGVLGGYLVAVVWLGVDGSSYWGLMHDNVKFWADIVNGWVKAVVFGFAVSLIAIYEGAMCRPTPEGVAQATTRTVVKSSLMVLALDFILTALMFQ